MMNFGYDSALQTTDKVRKMVVNDLLFVLLRWVVPPMWVTSVLANTKIINLDDFKTTVLWLLAVIGTTIHLHHRYHTNKQKRRLTELDIKKRERDEK